MWQAIRSSAIPMTRRRCRLIQLDMDLLRTLAVRVADDQLKDLVMVILDEHTPGESASLCTSCSRRWPCAEIVALHRWLVP